MYMHVQSKPENRAPHTAKLPPRRGDSRLTAYMQRSGRTAWFSDLRAHHLHRGYTHLYRALDLIARGRVDESFASVPDATTHCAHAKRTTYIVQNTVWTWLPAVLDDCVLLLWLRHHHGGATRLSNNHRCQYMFIRLTMQASSGAPTIRTQIRQPLVVATAIWDDSGPQR
jgi:hypothetical protein